MFFWRWLSHKKLMLDIWDPMDPNSKTTTLHPSNQLKSYPNHFHIEYIYILRSIGLDGLDNPARNNTPFGVSKVSSTIHQFAHQSNQS
jgi:hypothetical protein